MDRLFWLKTWRRSQGTQSPDQDRFLAPRTIDRQLLLANFRLLRFRTPFHEPVTNIRLGNEDKVRSKIMATRVAFMESSGLDEGSRAPRFPWSKPGKTATTPVRTRPLYKTDDLPAYPENAQEPIRAAPSTGWDQSGMRRTDGGGSGSSASDCTTWSSLPAR